MRLEDIEKLCNEATPGPWHYHHYGEKDGDEESFYDWWIDALDSSGKEKIKLCSHEATNHMNAKFIAASRELMPKLIAVAKAAQFTVCNHESGIRDYMSVPTDQIKDLEKALEELENAL